MTWTRCCWYLAVSPELTADSPDILRDRLGKAWEEDDMDERRVCGGCGNGFAARSARSSSGMGIVRLENRARDL